MLRNGGKGRVLMADEKLVLGTRGSALAVWQAEWVKAGLEEAWAPVVIEVRVIRTQGDKVLDTALSKIGGTGLFTGEIEKQLRDGDIDLAVHSLKDLPTDRAAGLVVAAVSEREDAADVLVSEGGAKLGELAKGAKVLTSSLRRKAQLLHRRGDLQVEDVRGNVPTRIKKMHEGDAAGMVMAMAGLKRLGLADEVSERFEPREFLPACGQGALAVETRIEDERVREMVSVLDDRVSRAATTAERAMLQCMGGGCQVPIGGYAWVQGDRLELWGMVADLAGEQVVRVHGVGEIDGGEELGRRVAAELLSEGGKVILDGIVRNGGAG